MSPLLPRRHSARGCARFVLLLLLVLAARDLHAQRPRAWVALAGGLGPVGGGDTTYQGSLGKSLRAAAALRLSAGWALEGSGTVERRTILNFGGNNVLGYACVGGQPCPSYYDFVGAGLAAVREWRRPGGGRRGALALGVGGYRVLGDFAARRTPAFGLQFGGERDIFQSRGAAVSLGTRAVLLPNVHGERLWHVPLELTLHTR
jgi:hypothetical protein